MTDQELKDLVASLAISHRETEKVLRDSVQEADRRNQEADRRAQEADRRFTKLEEQFVKTEEQFAKTDLQLAKLTQDLDRYAQEADQRAQETDRRDQEADRRAQETDRRAQETDRRAQETDRRTQEADRRAQERAQEADRRLAKLDEQFARTDRYLKKVSQMVGGMSNTQGKIAEEFFYRSLKKHPQIGNIRFDTVYRNLWGSTNGVEDEFDLILVNGDTLAMFEVKTKAQVDVVKTVIDRKIPHLRTVLPCFKEHQIYAGIASLVTSEELIQEVEKHGLFLLTQQGKHLEVVNTQVRPF